MSGLHRRPLAQSAGDDERVLQAHACAAEVLAFPAAEQLGAVRTKRDCQTVEFAELMIGLARGQRSGSMRELGLYSRLAMAALESRISCAPEDRVIETFALAWAELGNGFRIYGRLDKAARALKVASTLCRATRCTALELALLRFRASYYENILDLRRAGLVLRRAENLARSLRSAEDLASVWILQSNVFQAGGLYKRSLDRLRLAETLATAIDNQQNRLGCLHNTAGTLIAAGATQRGLECLNRYKHLYEHHGDDRFRQRRMWVVGRALANLGRLQQAEAALLEAKNYFAAEGCFYEETGIALSLMKLYSIAGLLGLAEEQASDARTIATAHGLRNQAQLADAFLEVRDAAPLQEDLRLW